MHPQNTKGWSSRIRPAGCDRFGSRQQGLRQEMAGRSQARCSEARSRPQGSVRGVEGRLRLRFDNVSNLEMGICRRFSSNESFSGISRPVVGRWSCLTWLFSTDDCLLQTIELDLSTRSETTRSVQRMIHTCSSEIATFRGIGHQNLPVIGLYNYVHQYVHVFASFHPG